MNGLQFENQLEQQIKIIHDKCLSGNYRFSPYLELLRSKGREKPPRLLAIPTVRDRIVLYAFKEILINVFSEAIPRDLANTYIYRISDFIKDKDPSNMGVFRADIKDFYGSINREELMRKLRARIKSNKILTLIKRAIESPIVPSNYRKADLKRYITETGIPQGLSISNILAAIYLAELDDFMRKSEEEYIYFRYVDDILIFTTKDKLEEVREVLEEKVAELKLSLNYDKTYSKSGNDEFEYLGYHFELPKVTVRQSSITKFINSITTKFSRYKHTKAYKLRKFKHLDEKSLKEAFVLDINEKITGAISDNRRYGWIFYFSSINDLTLLYKLDKIIIDLFKRSDDFDKTPPHNLKKLARAYYEAKYSPTSGYIYNYDSNDTLEKKRDFLSKRGKLEPNKQYSEEEITELYEKSKQKNLSELQKDDALVY